jgi:predicted esterase
VSACQANQPEVSVELFTEMANTFLDYGNFAFFYGDSARLHCVSDKAVWKNAMTFMKNKYDSVEYLRKIYYAGITDSSLRLNHCGLTDKHYLDDLFNNNDYQTIYETLKKYKAYSKPPATDHWTLYHMRLNDTMTVPFLLYIPSDYHPSVQTPLHVFLHGAVRHRPVFYTEGNIPQFEKSTLQPAVDRKVFLLYPMGKKDINWLFHPLAFEAIKKEIAYVKSLYNINDNKVTLSGHSNGGEGAFYFAINQPTTFSSFLAISYMPSAHITNSPLRNLRNTRYFYGISGQRDFIFNFNKIDSIYQYAKKLGVNWRNFSFDFDHDLPDAADPGLIKPIYDLLFSKTRNPFPPSIEWETDNVNNGKCDWIAITGLDTNARKASWVKAYNPPGVYNLKNTEIINFNARRSGVIRASAHGNLVTIKSSRVSKFKFYVYPDMIDIRKPITFIINDRKPVQFTVKKNKNILRNEFTASTDRIMLPVSVIELEP